MQKNLTTDPTGGQATTLAGLLDSLVADAHAELGTPPDTPTAFDVFLAGLVADAAAELAAPTPPLPRATSGPVYHVRTAVHGVDAELVVLLKDWDKSPAWLEFVARCASGLRQPGDKIVVSVPENNANNSRHGNDNNLLDRARGQGYRPPERPTDLYCIHFGDKVGRVRHSSGGAYRMAVDCRECGPDLRWWRMQKRDKYVYGQGEKLQTLVRVSGLATDDDAQAMLTAVGRTSHADGPRNTFLWRNPDSYLWEVALVYADAVDARGIVNLQHRRERVGYEWEIETRRVEPEELDAFMPTQSRTQRRSKDDKPDGGHDPVRFVGWCKEQERLPTDYAWSDVDVGDDSAAIMELPTRDQVDDLELEHLEDRVSDHWAIRWVKNERRAVIHGRRWLANVTLDADRLKALRLARNPQPDENGNRPEPQRGDWYRCIASGTYDGPRRLIIDLALALDDDAMVGFSARAVLRLASAYITEGVEE